MVSDKKLISRQLKYIRKRRLLKRLGFCRECFAPISEESNGEYVTCINCRIARQLRAI